MDTGSFKIDRFLDAQVTQAITEFLASTKSKKE